MRKKNISIFVVSMLTFMVSMFGFGINHSSSADYSHWDHQLTDNPKKAWSVSFNEPVKPTSVSRSTVYITDEENDKIKASVKVSEDRKTITVKPLISYVQGESYRLNVEEDVTSKNAENLTNTVVMPFKYVKVANNTSSSANKPAPAPRTNTNSPAASPAKEKGFDIKVSLGTYVSQVHVTANDYIAKVKVDRYEMRYEGDNKYKLGLSGLEKGKKLYIQGYNNSGRLVHSETYTIQ